MRGRVLITHLDLGVVRLGNGELRVVGRNHTSLADFLRPPTQMRDAILECAGRQSLGLPARNQRLDVFTLE